MRHAHGTPNVIKLLDFYERPDSFILILSRPSCYKVRTFKIVKNVHLMEFRKNEIVAPIPLFLPLYFLLE